MVVAEKKSRGLIADAWGHERPEWIHAEGRDYEAKNHSNAQLLLTVACNM